MSESIHVQRAKQWGLTPYIAEWLENAVKYCKDDPAGKELFEEW
jgi:hypothetical protein